jgi:hypothetical protein
MDFIERVFLGAGINKAEEKGQSTDPHPSQKQRALAVSLLDQTLMGMMGKRRHAAPWVRTR